MQLILVIVASVLPGILWVRYFQSKDRFEKEPWTKLFKVFVYGAVAVIPAALLEMPFRGLLGPDSPMLGRFLVSFFVVGLGEEFFKFAAVYWSIFRDPEFNEPVDGIIYGVTAAIGFSVVENVLYISTFGLEIAPVRAVIASLAHASFTGILGFYLGIAKQQTRPWPTIIKGIGIAAFLHGLYDFVLLGQFISPFIAILFVGALFFLLLHLIERSLESSPFQ